MKIPGIWAVLLTFLLLIGCGESHNPVAGGIDGEEFVLDIVTLRQGQETSISPPGLEAGGGIHSEHHFGDVCDAVPIGINQQHGKCAVHRRIAFRIEVFHPKLKLCIYPPYIRLHTIKTKARSTSPQQFEFASTWMILQ